MPADEARNIIEQIIEYAKNNNINRNEYSTFKRQNDIKQREVQGRTDRLNQFIDDRNRQLQGPLYPGQPSPNGFPDTPPPELAPNGYHPEYGKQAKRYTKLDPISAKTMNQVGTDDPETNKQVAAAAADPKTKKRVHAGAKKYAKRNVVKKESNNLYVRSRKYIDMDFVKDLHEVKIKKRNIAEKKKQQEIILDKLKKNEMKTSPKFSNWRRELREFGEWVPVSSGPANSATTTFGYFASGEQQVNFETGEPITFTYSGLDGIENYPSTITIDQGFGEVHTTNAPPFSQLGVQGYAAKINPKYKAAQEKYNKELKEWKKKENANLKAIKDTLKSFGTSWEEMRASKKWVKKLGDGTVVAIIPTDSNPHPMNWTNNVRVVKLKQCANASGPMSINYNPPGQYQDWVVENSEVQSEVYLQIGEQPKEPMESQYLMPRRTDFKDVNPQLDASQEFAQEVDADYMMNARVQDTPEQPSFNNSPVGDNFDIDAYKKSLPPEVLKDMEKGGDTKDLGSHLFDIGLAIAARQALNSDWALRTLGQKAWSQYQATGVLPKGLSGWNVLKAFTPKMLKTLPTKTAFIGLGGIPLYLQIGNAIGSQLYKALSLDEPVVRKKKKKKP